MIVAKVKDASMFNWLVFSSFVTSVIFTLLGLMMDLSYQLQLKPKIQQLQSEQAASLNNYMETRDLFLKHPVFNPQLGEGQNFEDLYGQLTSQNEIKRLLKESQKKEILELGQDWTEHKHKIVLPETVLPLFENIEDYSHWQPKRQLDNNVATDLIASGQYFLAYTAHNQPSAIRSSLEKVRHLSQILLKMENMNFKRAGLSLLEKENRLMEFIKAHMHRSQYLWTPVTSQELRQYRKHLNRSSYFLNYLTRPEVLQKVFLTQQTPLGFCAILAEKVDMLAWTKIFLEPQFPFEPDFNESLALVDQIAQKGQQQCFKSLQVKSNKHWVQHLPYYRRLFGIKSLIQVSRGGDI